MNQKAKIMICVPNLGTLHALLVERLLRWHTIPGQHYEQVALYAPRNIQPHDAARNHCVRKFLKTDSTHLFFIDSDVVPPIDAIDELLKHNVDVISGAYPIMKQNPNTEKAERVWALFNVAEPETGNIVPVDGEGVQPVHYCGGGCLMIKREVLEKLWANKEVLPFQWVLKGEGENRGEGAYGEDMHFCKLIGQSGIPLYANFDVKCYHYKAIML